MISKQNEENPFLDAPQSDPPQSNIDEYNKVLQESLNKTKIVIFVAISQIFWASSMYPIYILYIESISPETTTSQISLLMFIGNIYYGLFSLIYISASDKYGHDKLLILAFFINTLGGLLMAISNDIWLYIIGYFIATAPAISVGFAYIPSILPHKYAVRYCASLWTSSSVIYLLGPIIGSIIVNYSNYRTVYFVNTFYNFLCFLISFFTLRYIQKKKIF